MRIVILSFVNIGLITLQKEEETCHHHRRHPNMKTRHTRQNIAGRTTRRHLWLLFQASPASFSCRLNWSASCVNLL